MVHISEIEKFDDPATWDLFCSGRMKGIFQLERQGPLTAKAAPRNIAELSDLISIIRPGCCDVDTKILTTFYDRSKFLHTKGGNKRGRSRFRTIGDLYKRPPKTIISLDENNNLVSNEVLNIFPTGQKEVFNVKIRKNKVKPNQKCIHGSNYKLWCTDDHKLLRSDMEWINLEYLDPGDRIAVRKFTNNVKFGETTANRFARGLRVTNAKGSGRFSEICYKHYHEKCVMCEWNECGLDTHHIDGNRYTDNSPENLCFLCPNCHRKHHFGLISKEQLIEARNYLVLPKSNDIEWVTYMGRDLVGIRDTYDISMAAPYHNFIAGNFIVHNCKDSMLEGKSLTDHYVDRKNKIEEVTYIHPALEPILKSSQGILVMQEEILRIAIDIAGFTPEEADSLRASVGKKKADLIKELRIKFVDGAIKKGVVSAEIAEQIYDWIESAGRYSFNRCLDPNTLVETKLGEFKTLNNINIGEYIKSPTGYTKVLNKYENGIKELVEVTLSSGKQIACTVDHKFLCENGKILPLYKILEKEYNIVCDIL